MWKRIYNPSLAVIYALILGSLLLIAILGSHGVTVFVENSSVEERKCVIIDPGHGGVDGGATSCTGILESSLNLEIALRLNDMMHLLGIDTVMIRTTDESVFTKGDTIAAKKVSDLKQRVNMVNNTDHATLISIHQNHFTDSRYHGAQVFYAPTDGSIELARKLQSEFVSKLNPGSNRKAKMAAGIYLMQKITCPGVLVECGFLSNPEEEAKLRSTDYQKKLCSVIATTISCYLHSKTVA